MRKNKVFILGMFAILLALFGGCASSPSPYRTYTTDFLITNNKSKVEVASNNVGFGDVDGITGKINGEILYKGEKDFLLDAGNGVNEVMFIVDFDNRGLLSSVPVLNWWSSKTICVKAALEYQFEAGKTYSLIISESMGSNTIGAFVASAPISCYYTLYADKSSVLTGKMETLDTSAIKQ